MERLVPVAPTLVVSVSRAIEHGEHDGDIQSVVVLVLYVPGKHAHWKAGVLKEWGEEGVWVNQINTTHFLTGREHRKHVASLRDKDKFKQYSKGGIEKNT